MIPATPLTPDELAKLRYSAEAAAYADSTSPIDVEFLIGAFRRQVTPLALLRLLESLSSKDAEIAELRERLRLDRIGTHAEDCHLWGPKHYECLRREFAKRDAELAALRERMGKVEAIKKWMPTELRYWNRKHEFFGHGNPTTFKDREEAAIRDLYNQGDTCEIVINEGDWLMVCHVFRALRAALDDNREGK